VAAPGRDRRGGAGGGGGPGGPGGPGGWQRAVAAILLALACGLVVVPGAGSQERLRREGADYAVPDVTLVDQDGAAFRLAVELGRPGPVVLQFIFTTCATVCPALSGTLAAAQDRLPGVHLLSISIDPEEDTPARLAEYARRFGAGPRWRLLTGRLEDVVAVERAFDAYRGNKMRHEPLTFARAAPGRPWVRLEGLLTGGELAAEVRRLAGAGAAGGTAADGTAVDGTAAARTAADGTAAARTAPDGTAAAGTAGTGRAGTGAAGTGAAAAGAAAAGTAGIGGAAAGAAALAAETALARGRRIYREGVLPSGKPLRAILAGGATVEEARLACAACHRPSGYGGVEAGTLVPPVTAPALFGRPGASAAELLGKLYQEELAQASWTRLRSAATARRPAYTAATLSAAVSRGIDSAGRALDPLMPRYELDAGAMGDLAAYLRTLSATPAPGVDAAAIHLAVVVAGDVEPDRRRAMLDVAQAFVHTKNAETRRLLARPPTSPGYRDEQRRNWREWVLHVWDLPGPPASWAEELERRYRARPVFALLSGIAAGTAAWRPVHDFCERRGIPSLFPNTDLPVVSPAGAWTLYLSEGLALEGRSLARYLAEERRAAGGEAGTAAAKGQRGGAERGPLRIVQVFRDGAAGATAAASLREAMGAEAVPTAGRLEDVVLGAKEAVASASGSLVGRLAGQPPAALVLWLDGADVAALAPALTGAGGTAVRELYLSYSLLGEELPPLPDALRARARLSYRFALPGSAAPGAYRARAWLLSHGVAGTRERIRLDTLFAFGMAADALERLAGNFSRAYFVETIERETERTANPGVYPRLGLGAGQRFAAKGCYLVKLAPAGPAARPSLAAEGDWIVP
jgi:cytochrome oxidase Cu insertion factor (SCO1/SenC/PrrC family)